MKKWKYKTNNKLRGTYGQTDFAKKTIEINKKLHRTTKNKRGTGFSKKDITLINTMVHEDLHRKHPRMTEKMVRKLTKTKVAIMTPAQKARLRSKFK